MHNILKSLLAALLIALSTISSADVVLQDTQGKNTPFSSLKGKWVLINYWAGWCETCIDEIPEFNRFYNNHRNDPIALFGVNYDALPAVEQNNLIKQFNISYPSLLNDPGRALELGDIRGVPVTFVFNPKGELVQTLYGGQTAETLNQVVALTEQRPGITRHGKAAAAGHR